MWSPKDYCRRLYRLIFDCDYHDRISLRLQTSRTCILWQLRRLACEQLASLVCMKASAETSSSSLDISPDINDATVPNITKQLDQTLSSSAVSAVEHVLGSINDLLETRLRSDAQLRLQTDKHQQMRNDWKKAGAVIDRVCFIVFSITLVVGSFVFYLLFLSRP